MRASRPASMEIVGAEQPTADRIRERHARLHARLRDTAAANGHDPERLRIVAVTKTWPVEVARAALDAGLTRLGESRVQEAEPKIAAVPEAEWHFIGRLQSNKARRAVRGFSFIHSVDSFELLQRIGELALEESRTPALLLQVNVTGEDAKAGLAPEAVLDGRRIACDGRSHRPHDHGADGSVGRGGAARLRSPSGAAGPARAGGRHRSARALDGHERRCRGGCRRGRHAGPDRDRAVRAAPRDAAILPTMTLVLVNFIRLLATVLWFLLIARVVLSWTNPTGGGAGWLPSSTR